MVHFGDDVDLLFTITFKINLVTNIIYFRNYACLTSR